MALARRYVGSGMDDWFRPWVYGIVFQGRAMMSCGWKLGGSSGIEGIPVARGVCRK